MNDHPNKHIREAVQVRALTFGVCCTVRFTNETVAVKRFIALRGALKTMRKTFAGPWTGAHIERANRRMLP